MTNRTMKFNPAFLSDEELIQSFVVRHADLKLITEIVRNNTSQSNQHVLAIGPRGIGKTTLVLRVAAEIRRDAELSQKWYPLVFGEESYRVCSPGEFWLEAIFHLARQTKESRWRKTHEDLHDIQDEDRLRESALAQLMDFADEQNKRILLIVENLHQLLGDQIHDNDAWTLRHTLQNEPRVMLLATATTRFEEIENHGKAMFELFKPHDLKPLDVEDCRAVWQAKTGNLFTYNQIRPIQILTGGNPRLITIIAQFAKDISLQHLMRDLIQLVDDHTEYFKTHLDNLAVVERKVYLALAEIWEPATAKEVAAAARLDVNKTSALLKRLIERGAVVVLDNRKRTKSYYVAERMYNIYYLMRRRGGASGWIKAVIHFMMEFFGQKKSLEIITQEACQLSPDLRQDHYEVFKILLEETPINERKDLLKITPPQFLDMQYMPESLKELIDLNVYVDNSDNKYESNKIQESMDLFEKSYKLFKDGNYPKAEKIVRKIIEKEPDNPFVWRNLSYLLKCQNRLPEAEEAYTKYHTIINKLIQKLRSKSCVSFEKRDYKAAEEIEKQILDYSPDDASAWGNLGILLARQKRLSEAEEAHHNAIRFQSNDCGLLFNYGVFLQDQNRFGEAEKIYKKVIKINPNHVEVWDNLGNVFHKQNRFQDSEEAYRKAIELRPDDAYAYNNFGILLKDQKRYSEAESLFRKSIQLKPDNAEAYFNLGNLLRFLYRLKEAEEAYRKTLELQPDYADAWMNLGLIFEYKNKLYESKKTIQKAIELQHNHANAWYNLGNLCFKLDQLLEAEEAYKKSIEYQPDNVNAWTNLGILYDRKSCYKDAEEAYRNAISIQPDFSDALNNLANLLLQQNQLKEAEEYSRKALDISSDNPIYQHTLASILIEKGGFNEAYELIKKFLKDYVFITDYTNDINDLIIILATKGYASQALEILQSSPSAEILKPLIVGLRLYMGEDERDIKTPLEVLEIGKDVKARIEERKAEMEKENRPDGL